MKIALLGFGVEGRSAYTYLKTTYPEAQFTIYSNEDIREGLPEQASIHIADSFQNIDADMVIRTPSIAPNRISSSGEITSVTKLFFKNCPAPIIGVTGSKGKGTTSCLIAEILKAGGKTVHLVGNIGVPALDKLNDIQADDFVVYELSSFQLWDLKQSPQVAVVLMIEPDHLEVHMGMGDYVSAKSNITKHQRRNDLSIFYEANEYSRAIGEASPGQKVSNPSSEFAHIKGDYFYYGDKKLCQVSALKLPGAHNRDNATAAIAACWRWVQDGETIAKGLSSFEGLPHRLKFVREFEGVKYYDDSIATTPGSAIAALHAFKEPKVIILGGSSKGATYAELAREVSKSSIRQVLLIGEEAEKIAIALDGAGCKEYTMLGKVPMTRIVAEAHNVAKSGDIVVMSPSCASFDMFKNYKDRGEQFIAAVEAL
jgi:UDP-N-acetylmuramoylalanine--D-glutamate ligase